MLIPDINPAPLCERSQIGTALKRCRHAWQRAHRLFIPFVLEASLPSHCSFSKA
jgi:hypothetical protein